MIETQYCTHLDSPLGRLWLAGNGDGLTAIVLPGDGIGERRKQKLPVSEAPFREAVRQLKAYFAGDLKKFELSLAPKGTPFQQVTWEVLQEIPYGQTLTYGDVARRIRRPSAVRAVGAANRCNPLPIVIPCHRVVGSNGQLTGYAGGLDIKRWLLSLEGAWDAGALRARAVEG